MAVPEKFRKIVGGGTLAAGAVGLPGGLIPHVDVPVLLTIWATGAAMISDKAGYKTTKQQWQGLITTALGGVALYVAGSKLAAQAFKVVPVLGILASMGVNSALNAFFTYRFLRGVAKVYDNFDGEEINFALIKHSLTVFAPWLVASEFADMLACMQEGSDFKDLFS